jgi:hypothetical protein
MGDIYWEKECQYYENESLLDFLSFDSPEQHPPQQNIIVDQHFHPFPKLPTELRLQIWREAFPKARNVYLGVQCCTRRPGADLPVTLMVSRESREETLRHYIIFSQREVDNLDSEDRNHFHLRNPSFICLNPSVDNIYMEFYHLFDKINPSCKNLISTIRAQFPRQFGRIHKLHVYNCAWDERFIRDDCCDSTETWRSCLELFRNLEEVRITSVRNPGFTKIKNTKDGLSKWIRRRAERELGYKVPKVLVSARSNTVVDVVDRSTFISLILVILAIFFTLFGYSDNITIDISCSLGFSLGLGFWFFTDNSPQLS